MYSEEFVTFVKNGIGKYFIGTGNPNSNILIVGKESAIDSNDNLGMCWYNNNAIDWKKHIFNNTSEELEYFVNENNHLRKGWGKNTWSKYQKLNDYIFEKTPKSFYVDFLKNIFTTEINDSPDKNTVNANKSGLNERKRLFKKSAFIQNFPVVILACSNYIQNNDNIREIDDIFNVTYFGDEKGKYWYNKGNWFFLHYTPDYKKLVIHTRQLSADVKNKMLEDMGRIVREHLIKIEKY